MLAKEFRTGQMHFRRGFGYGYTGTVFYDPRRAGAPVGRGTYEWDGAAGLVLGPIRNTTCCTSA